MRSLLELEENEAAVSMCLARFASWPEEKLVLVVGTAQGLSFYPRQVDGEPTPASQFALHSQ